MVNNGSHEGGVDQDEAPSYLQKRGLPGWDIPSNSIDKRLQILLRKGRGRKRQPQIANGELIDRASQHRGEGKDIC